MLAPRVVYHICRSVLLAKDARSSLMSSFLALQVAKRSSSLLMRSFGEES